jgi:phosphohistidine phosphatase
MMAMGLVTKVSRICYTLRPVLNDLSTAMKRLYLLRHAEAALNSPTHDDFDRPLTPQGRQSAPSMGRHMRNLGYAPAIALCSPAQRARETWAHIQDALGGTPIVETPRALYLPEPRTLLDLVRAVDDALPSAIAISHNPGILALALSLLDSDLQPANPFGDYPAGALAVFDFDIPSWAGVQPGEGALIGFTRPQELDSAA